MLKNICYIISNINKSLAFEWIVEEINTSKFALSFILLNSKNSCLENFLIEKKIKVSVIKYKSKKDIPIAILKISYFLLKNKIDVVHTHLFDANFAGLIAAKLTGIKKRIHTRHHSNFNHLYHPKSVKFDRIINYLSTDIIAISEIVKDVLVNKEDVSAKKIQLIHHGFKLDEFTNASELSVTKLKRKYLGTNSYPVIGVISRYMELKGIQYIIPTFEKLLPKYPNAILVLANANGNYKAEIQKMLQKIPKQNFIEIDFETDLFALYKIFDVFIHVPIEKEIEAFGQIYVEALAAGIPSVFTLSGVANEFIEDRKNALVVSYKNDNAIYKAVLELLEDKPLAISLIKNGKTDVALRFNFSKMMFALEGLYGK
jgi:glycosyltransferase involved in cell wall biosynthesis